MNKVPSKQGYVPNEYTGRSKMTYGGMERKKAAMGMSKMDEEMVGSMRKQMMSGSKMYGMSYGGRVPNNRGGKASSDIFAMEKDCSMKTGKNASMRY